MFKKEVEWGVGGWKQEREIKRDREKRGTEKEREKKTQQHTDTQC